MIRVALIGVGNCASSLVQGVTYYARDPEQNAGRVPGLMHRTLGPYAVSDIRIVAAFDVNRAKVGRDLAEAIQVAPNNTIRFADVPPTGVMVLPAPQLDGVGQVAAGRIPLNGLPADMDRVVAVLQDEQVDVVVNYLPVGSEVASRAYALAAAAAGCAFVNCIPVFLAKDPAIIRAFEAAGQPLLGDDIKSQLGATITHRMLAHLFETRGIRLDRTYQLNVGGNMDFYNMLERSRLESKRTSKADAVTAELSEPPAPEDVHIGPSDYVAWLTDRKVAIVRCEGTAFGGVPLRIDMTMEVWDSPNSAGVVVDAIRAAQIARDTGRAGVVPEAAAWLFKAPPIQYTDDLALAMLDAFAFGSEVAHE